MTRLPAIMMGIAAVLMAASAPAQQAGTQAPNFTLADTTGRTVQLADYRGKFVVLEWTNPDCPFVQSHYDARSMQGLQREWGAHDVVWLTINSTNQHNAEYKNGAQMAKWMQSRGAAQKAVLIDGSSDVGRAYAAKTTPQMFVIDPSGRVIYDGAMDEHRSARASMHNASDNYVQAALSAATTGRPVQVASTQPYGCSVKY